MKFNKKILMSLLVSGLIVGLVTPSIMNANELDTEEEIVEVEETKKVEEPETAEVATKETKAITTYALTDPAFPASSKPLHDAILAKYPAINTDTDGSVGYISIGEANAWTQHIIITNTEITGTLNGIENFINVKWIELWGNQLDGSIPTNIGNVTGLKYLNLHNNNLSGSIPASIGSLTDLKEVRLFENNLSGSIPTTIGGMTALEQLQLQSNQLTGSIPVELGNLPALSNLNLNDNLLSGGIPKELGNISTLKALQLGNNPISGEIPVELGDITGLQRIIINGTNLTGEIPNSILELPNLIAILAQDNPGLTGNLVENIPSTSTINKIDVSGTGIVQALPTNPSLNPANGGVFIYDNLAESLLNTDGTLLDGVTQADIDRAQESANYWSEPIKSEWQANIDIAQELLYQRDAETAVNDLFDADGTIEDTIIQKDIEDAQDLVDKVTDADKKQELQDKLDEAQKQLDQRDFVVLEGFETFTGTGTVSTKIDAPVEKFSKVYVDGKLLPLSNYIVTSGSTVITLNESYLKILANGTYDVEVEFVSGAKVSVLLTIDVKATTNPTDPTDPTNPVDPIDPTNPTDPTTPTTPTNPTKPSHPSVDVPVVSKPSTSTTSTTSNGIVNTADTTNLTILYALLASLLLGFVVIAKRRKEQH